MVNIVWVYLRLLASFGGHSSLEQNLQGAVLGQIAVRRRLHMQKQYIGRLYSPLHDVGFEIRIWSWSRNHCRPLFRDYKNVM